MQNETTEPQTYRINDKRVSYLSDRFERIAKRARRIGCTPPTFEILNKYAHDYKVVFVGDATMAPYEITHAGGSVEHWNEEPGAVWINRFATLYDKLIWINPTPQETWEYSNSVAMTRELVNGKMYPLTIRGLEEGMSALTK